MPLNITELIGRFHPVLVHLPIGILLFALLLLWLSRMQKYSSLAPAVRIALLLGAISAIVSCISGLFLASNGDYDEQTVVLHKWMGLLVAMISSSCYVLFSFPNSFQGQKKIAFGLSGALFVMIFITGHLGGTLTHGEGFLTEPLQKIFEDSVPLAGKKIIPNVQEAKVYDDIIQPLLQNKCYRCHSSVKQKGGLRLDTREWIVKGGKDGEILGSGSIEKSELYKRLTLDPLEEHHMPPKGRPQPSEAEIALIHWWISSGTSFDKKVKDFNQPEKIKPILLSLQSADNGPKSNPEVPGTPVGAAPDSTLAKLRELGVVILPVGAGTNYLSANIISGQQNGLSGDQLAGMLEPLATQLIWLKMGNTNLTEKGMRSIGRLRALTRLNLDHTGIDDQALSQLKGLDSLQYLNLVGTEVTARGLITLKALPKLHSIYLYQTRIGRNDWELLFRAFPKTKLDSGGYSVPFLPTDTAIVRQAPAKTTP